MAEIVIYLSKRYARGDDLVSALGLFDDMRDAGASRIRVWGGKPLIGGLSGEICQDRHDGHNYPFGPEQVDDAGYQDAIDCAREKGLKLLDKARRATGLAIVTEALEPDTVEPEPFTDVAIALPSFRRRPQGPPPRHATSLVRRDKCARRFLSLPARARLRSRMLAARDGFC